MSEPLQSAVVVQASQLSPSVRELVIAPLEQRVSFKPGQWVSLRLPVGNHPPLVRAYSMVEPESSSGRLVLAFDRVPGGLGSGYLFTLKEGDRVTVSGPYGKFLLPDPLTLEPVFFARYTGIVPVRCILKHLLAVSHSGPITLSYSAPSQSELVYRDDFIALASSHPHFRYIETVAQPNDHAKPVQEWSELSALLPHLEKRKDFVPMISGVKAFVHPLRAYFIERGFGRREIRVETYD